MGKRRWGEGTSQKKGKGVSITSNYKITRKERSPRKEPDLTMGENNTDLESCERFQSDN